MTTAFPLALQINARLVGREINTYVKSRKRKEILPADTPREHRVMGF